MRIAIVDDEIKWCTLALKVVEENVDVSTEIDLYTSGPEFISRHNEYDVVLMDIEMPGMDGFDTSIKYKENYPDAIIIILTTHLEMSRRGYLVNAFRYIDKNLMKEEIAEAFEKINQINKRNGCCIVGRNNTITKSISINDILFIETKAKGIVMHTEEGTYISDEKINELESLLEKYDFFRSHKSFLINLNAVEKIDKQFAYFVNKKKAYISVRKYAETKRKYIVAKKKNASM